MNNSAQFLILASNNHHMFEQLKNLSGHKCCHLLELDTFETNLEPKLIQDIKDFKGEAIFDFTLLSKEHKYLLLKHITQHFSANVISDLSLYWGEEFLTNFPRLNGAMATAFYSPNKTYECFISPDNNHTEGENIGTYLKTFFTSLNINFIKVNRPGIGFHFPRTISMIINEAYFALEENICEEKDLDIAMRYGVNYPLGPVEWGKKIGEQHIVTLLDELFKITSDSRYKVALNLRQKAKQLTKDIL